MTTTQTTAAQFIHGTGPGPVDVPAHLYGFGGLHGGLVLARLTAIMGAHVMPGTALRAISAQYHRPIRGSFTTDACVRRAGRGATTVSADAVSETGDVLVSAGAVFGAVGHAGFRVPGPTPPPAARAPEAWDVFEIPTEFVPVAAATEIRPVGPGRPYAGGGVPELTAWVRMVDDDTPPDVLALIFLLDALAPSYAAVLSEPRPVPTVELSVQPNTATSAASPWVLIRARTVAAHDGWVHEHIDGWDVEGAFLGSARQLRLAR